MTVMLNGQLTIHTPPHMHTSPPSPPSQSHLNVPEGIITLLLPRARGGAEVEETVDSICQGPSGCRQLVHDVGCIRVSREGLGCQQQLAGGDRNGAKVPQHLVAALSVLSTCVRV